MEFTYTNSYKKHGCNINGYLIVVELTARAKQIASTQPLAGFGGMASYKALGEAKAIIQERHSSYTLELAIPDLVVKIDGDEWKAFVESLQADLNELRDRVIAQSC